MKNLLRATINTTGDHHKRRVSAVPCRYRTWSDNFTISCCGCGLLSIVEDECIEGAGIDELAKKSFGILSCVSLWVNILEDGVGVWGI